MIGQLRTRIGIYSALETPDEMGGATTAWPFFKAVWADVRPLSINESAANGGAQVAVKYRVVIRYLGSFPKRARLMWGAQTLRVLTSSDPDNRRERLHLICEEELS